MKIVKKNLFFTSLVTLVTTLTSVPSNAQYTLTDTELSQKAPELNKKIKSEVISLNPNLFNAVLNSESEPENLVAGWPHPCTLDPPGHCGGFVGNGHICLRCYHSWAVHE